MIKQWYGDLAALETRLQLYLLDGRSCLAAQTGRGSAAATSRWSSCWRLRLSRTHHLGWVDREKPQTQNPNLGRWIFGWGRFDLNFWVKRQLCETFNTNRLKNIRSSHASEAMPVKPCQCSRLKSRNELTKRKFHLPNDGRSTAQSRPAGGRRWLRWRHRPAGGRRRLQCRHHPAGGRRWLRWRHHPAGGRRWLRWRHRPAGGWRRLRWRHRPTLTRELGSPDPDKPPSRNLEWYWKKELNTWPRLWGKSVSNKAEFGAIALIKNRWSNEIRAF